METTAADMARAAGVDPKRFRAALRSAGLAWHREGTPWNVEIGGPRHRQMEAVLQSLGATRAVPTISRRPGGRSHSDEAYVIGLCDAVLRAVAIRQHRFDFLRGDPGSRGEGARLPVDGWYPAHNLVVEYRERQHSEAIAFFDRRVTVSGMGRGEQRARYDQRRRDVLAERGVGLVEIDFSMFAHDRARRIIWRPTDRDVVERALRNRLSTL